MDLSIEVNQQNGTLVYLCRGRLMRGWASEYLFDLLTRPIQNNIILDLNDLVTFDTQGLLAVALSCSFLCSCRRHLVLRNAPPELAHALRAQHGAYFHEITTLDSAIMAESAGCIA